MHLNPCCNGIYLIIEKEIFKHNMQYGLNPCCNGIYLIIRMEVKLRSPKVS